VAKKKPTWKGIALALAQRVNFACTHLQSRYERSGGGLLLNIRTGTSQHWKEYFAEALEMVPGVKVDRELLHAKNDRERRAIIKRKRMPSHGATK
jgi:hypothetical protein